MQVTKFEDRDAWLDARLGKVTGTRLKDIVVKRGTAKKIGFYELIAERIAIPADDENRMDRGIRLETEAIERFTKETGKEVNTDLVIWSRDDNKDIAISPDGYIGETEAVECKCLASPRHLEALLTKQIPSEYEMQALMYFIVNDTLKTLYFVLYDPRMPAPNDFFFITINREDVAEDVATYLDFTRNTLQEVEDIVKQLTF